jgi:hypothetical protein
MCQSYGICKNRQLIITQYSNQFQYIISINMDNHCINFVNHTRSVESEGI